MNRRSFVQAATGLMATLSAWVHAAPNRVLKSAWSAWENGDIALAQSEAEKHLAEAEKHVAEGAAPDEARHLLVLTRFVSGDYKSALAHFAAITPSYVSPPELDSTVLEAHLHLGDPAKALEFIRGRPGQPEWLVPLLERQVIDPFRGELTGPAEVAFADHPLTQYFPAFAVEIDGVATTAHVDTGGAYVYMGTDRAKSLGIETTPIGKGAFHLNLATVQMSLGIAKRFALGNAVWHNVPVTVIPTLSGQSDYIIFGTRMLQEFLPTLDYPRSRLILTPRTERAITPDAQERVPPGVRIPFYLWGDHPMFARGNWGDARNLNFFIDSGLVVIRPDGKGGTKQCAFTTSKRKLESWGAPSKDLRNGYFASPQPLGLGPLQQEGHLIEIGAAGDNNFGGVRIDGLLSHGFLKQYAWTIDFDAREYIFSS